MVRNLLKSLVLIFLLPIRLPAQAQKELNWIIVIDKEIAVVFSNPEFIITTDTDSIVKFRTTYYPGNLVLDEEKYNILKSSKIKSISFEMLYYTNDKHQTIENYKINIPKGFIFDRYVIIDIFNLKIKRYRKKYLPQNPGDEYAVMLRSSSQGVVVPGYKSN